MTLDVDVTKRIRNGPRVFDLRVRFATSARRTVLYGPSGAGKSLTLQAIAGLQTPDAGRIALDGDVLFDRASGVDVPARRRGFGFLFQDYALFPRLTVRQNIAFGLSRGLGNPSSRIATEPVRRWLDAFELDDVADQRPGTLSGGQRQRTALARALVNDPRALLLDEPFSALDPALRGRMRDELDRLLDTVDLQMLMITHDPEDLARFGDAAFHLEHGAVTAPPEHTMKTSARNHFAGTVSAIRDGTLDDEIEIALAADLRVVATVTRGSRTALGLAVGHPAFALVKASSIILATGADDVKLSARNQVAGKVLRIVRGAISTEVVLQAAPGIDVVAVITNDSAANLGLEVGMAATALFKASSVVLGVGTA